MANKNSKLRNLINRVFTGGNRTISENKKRNMQMIVMSSPGHTMTRHVPINPDLPSRPYAPAFQQKAAKE